MKKKIDRKVILPLDGFPNSEKLLEALKEFFSIEGLADIVSHVKFNDVLYGADGSETVVDVIAWLKENGHEDVKIFLDLKLSDTVGTNLNILKQYEDKFISPDIITVRDCCSSETFNQVSSMFPEAKVALVSLLTDMSEQECYERYSMEPVDKINRDILSLDELCPGAITAVVCSPLEVEVLKREFPELDFIVPGIRDKWMQNGQQKRVTGVRQALENGADYVVMGSQLTEGNPQRGISAAQSVAMTLEQIAGVQMILPNDHLQTLSNFDAVYVSPKKTDGSFAGPLVAYAGKGSDEKPLVGYHYYNMARIEQNPRAMGHFASLLAERVIESGISPDVVIGAPMGGIALAVALSQLLGCKFAFAEKKVTALAADEHSKDQEELVIKRHDISKGDRVLVIEDLCNNFSTTQALATLINAREAEFIGIACIVNRSFPMRSEFEGLPVVSVVEIETEQYEQTDPRVQEHLANGHLVLKPKHDWPLLKKAMETKTEEPVA